MANGNTAWIGRVKNEGENTKVQATSIGAMVNLPGGNGIIGAVNGSIEYELEYFADDCKVIKIKVDASAFAAGGASLLNFLENGDTEGFLANITGVGGRTVFR